MYKTRVRSTKFNLNDPQERKMNNYIDKHVGNFAGYVKRLIWNDMQNIKTTPAESTDVEISNNDVSYMEDLV